MKALLLAAVSLPLCAQVAVSLSPMPPVIAKHLLSGRLRRQVTVWQVSIENLSPEPVVVSESAILRRIPQLGPLDRAAMSLLIDEAGRNSGWARAGRVTGDLAKLAAFLSAGGIVRWGVTATTALTGFGSLEPYIVERLVGVEAPLGKAWEALAFTQPISLAPGDTATAHVFTQRWDKPVAVSVTLDTARVPMRKVIQ